MVNLPAITKRQATSPIFKFPDEDPDSLSTRGPSDTTSKSPPNSFTTSSTSASLSPSVWNTGQSLFAGVGTPSPNPGQSLFGTPSPNPDQSKAPSGIKPLESNGRSVFDTKPPLGTTAFGGFGATFSPGLFSAAESTSTSATKERGLVAPVRLLWEPNLIVANPVHRYPPSRGGNHGR